MLSRLDSRSPRLTVLRLLVPVLLLSPVAVAQESQPQSQQVETAAAVVLSAPDLAGRWTGTWSSQSTGHQGPMTAEFCRVNDSQYAVSFTGKFCAIIPFRYKATLNAKHNPDGSVQLSGSRHLGLLFGTFRFQGTVTDNRFQATYCSKDDTGNFRLTRQCPR